MWKYECVTKQEFESIKDKIEEFIVSLGGNEMSVDLPYTQRTVSYSGTDLVENISTRPVFEYNEQYYRVDEVCYYRCNIEKMLEAINIPVIKITTEKILFLMKRYTHISLEGLWQPEQSKRGCR